VAYWLQGKFSGSTMGILRLVQRGWPHCGSRTVLWLWSDPYYVISLYYNSTNKMNLGSKYRTTLTAEARVHARVSPCGIFGGQSGNGTDFFPVLRFYPFSIIPPLLHIHSCLIWGVDKAPVSGRSSTETLFHPIVTKAITKTHNTYRGYIRLTVWQFCCVYKWQCCLFINAYLFKCDYVKQEKESAWGNASFSR
jgi:hypothetical protein